MGPVAFCLCGLVALMGIMGNFERAWTLGEDHGGLWRYCPGPVHSNINVGDQVPSGTDAYDKDHCYTYNKDAAGRYGHDWTMVSVAKGLLLAGIILSVAVFIFILLQMCRPYTCPPFFAGGI